MRNIAQEEVTRLEHEIRSKFHEIERICDENMINFYWSGMSEYGDDSVTYTHGNAWYSSSMNC